MTSTIGGVRIHRAAEAPALEESGAVVSDFGGDDALRQVATTLAGADCSITRLLVHQGPEEGGMSVAYLYFKPGFPLFPHHHDVDSLYVVVSGSLVELMGTETLRPGDCFSVQAGTSYHYTAGPDGVEVLEIFRDADQVTVAYGPGASDRVAQAQRAVAEHRAEWAAITEGPLLRANRGC
jgi:mannose-6-phosphate isomerase-like protein (cupin superfamily)